MGPRKRSRRDLRELEELVVKHARIEESGEAAAWAKRVGGAGLLRLGGLLRTLLRGQIGGGL